MRAVDYFRLAMCLFFTIMSFVLMFGAGEPNISKAWVAGLFAGVGVSMWAAFLFGLDKIEVNDR